VGAGWSRFGKEELKGVGFDRLSPNGFSVFRTHTVRPELIEGFSFFS